MWISLLIGNESEGMCEVVPIAKVAFTSPCNRLSAQLGSRNQARLFGVTILKQIHLKGLISGPMNSQNIIVYFY